MNPLLIVGIVASLMSAGATWKVTSYYYRAEADKLVIAANEKRIAAEDRANEIANKFESRLSKIKVENRTIINEVQRETLNPAYDCPLPDSGIRLLNRSRGIETKDTGKPVADLPTLGSGIRADIRRAIKSSD